MAIFIPEFFHDKDTTRRVARVMLKYTKPKDREEAYRILDSRLGIYIRDYQSLNCEVDKYFA